MAKFRKNSKGQYSKKARETALKLYVEDGPGAAAKETGISRSTISKWATRAGVADDRTKSTQKATEAAAAEAARQREQIKVECRRQALEMIRRLGIRHEYFVGKEGTRRDLDLPTASDVREYSVAIGVLIDKAELLDGRATDRTETRSVDQLDREIDKLLSGESRVDRVTA